MQPSLILEYTQIVEKISHLIEDNKLSSFTIVTVKETPSYQMVLDYKKAIVENKEILKNIDKRLKDLQHQKIMTSIQKEENEITFIQDKKVLFKQMQLEDMQLIKIVADTLYERYPQTLIFIISCFEDKTLFVAKAPQEYVKLGIHCGQLVKEAATLCNGKGGGRPDMAQAGGQKVDNVSIIIDKIKECLQ